MANSNLTYPELLCADKGYGRCMKVGRSSAIADGISIHAPCRGQHYRSHSPLPRSDLETVRRVPPFSDARLVGTSSSRPATHPFTAADAVPAVAAADVRAMFSHLGMGDAEDGPLRRIAATPNHPSATFLHTTSADVAMETDTVVVVTIFASMAATRG